MNTRSKYVHFGNRPISVSRILKYVELNSIDKESIEIDTLLNTNVLPHLCRFAYSTSKSVLLYDTLTIGELANYLSNYDTVKMDEPIILMDDRVIDGVHRILKCKLSGVQTITAYRLTTNDFVNILNRRYKR